MSNKLNYVLTGLFVIVLGAVWLGISLWLALGDIRTEYTTYRVYLNESVSGLYVDAPVKYRGVQIGKVKDIALNPDNTEEVRLTLEIESSVPIKTDTIAVLTVQGLTGIAFVDLTGGSRSAPLLEAATGACCAVIPSGPSFFARLDTSGMELLADLNTLAQRLVELLDVEGRQQIEEIIENTKTITAVFARQENEIERGLENASSMFATGRQAAGQLQPLLVQLQNTAGAFEQMALNISQAGASLNEYMQSSSAGIQQFSRQTLPEIGALVSELRRLADTLQGIGRELEQDPRILLYGRELEMPGPGE